MAEDKPEIAATPEPAATPAASPADAVESAAPAAIVEAPVVEAPKPDAAKEPSAEEQARDTPSLAEEAAAEAEKLEGGKPEDEKKPGEEAKPEEEKKGEVEQPKAELPPLDFAFQPYKFPEDFQADEAKVTAFNDVLRNQNLDPQTRGQTLVDLHLGEMAEYARWLTGEQFRVFNETRKDWRSQIATDPELGGTHYKTTLRNLAEARDMFVPEKRRGDFDKMLRTTGAGDHPEFARFMDAVMQKFKEPAPPPPGPGKPPADIGRKPGQSGRRAALYDHPNSENKRNR